MRSETEMFDLIINVAMEDDRIYGVYMNGSRSNKNAVIDIFQDYDIVYVVKETESFIEDKMWIDRFGSRLFMQYPEENPDYPNDKDNVYGWLIQFTDGNRLDLHVETLARAKKVILEDKLCKILLDKDNIFPDIKVVTDEDYWVNKPSQTQYLCTCNEFWWCLDNVAKGLWREEIPYVQDMVNFHVRKELEKMLSWKIGIQTDFSVSVGKSGKYMHRWLSKTEWKDYLSTYFSENVAEAWVAVLKMCDLFEETAVYVGEKLGYEYNAVEGKNCRFFLEHVKELPKDATEIFSDILLE